MNFIMMADSNYEFLLNLSVRKTMSLYPDAVIHVLDLGMSDSALTALSSLGVFIYEKSELASLMANFPSPSQRRRMIIREIFKKRKIPNKNLRKLLYDNKRLYFECLCVYKPLFIRHILEKNKGDDFYLYLDADAFLLEPLDQLELFSGFVTVRFRQDISFDFGNMMIVNAGVAGFRSTKKGIDLVDKWLSELKTSTANNFEQTALNCVAWDFELTDERFQSAVIEDLDQLSGTELLVRDGVALGSCEYYNYYSTENLPSKSPGIVHFKGGVRSKEIQMARLSEWGLVNAAEEPIPGSPIRGNNGGF